MKKTFALLVLGMVLTACPREVEEPRELEEPQFWPTITDWDEQEPVEVEAHPSGSANNGNGNGENGGNGNGGNGNGGNGGGGTSGGGNQETDPLS